MAWFVNYYHCDRCGDEWPDEWSAMCDDECGTCAARDISPYRSDDSTNIVVERSGSFIVMQSPEEAEYDPDYKAVADFPTLTLGSKPNQALGIVRIF
jgi:hypothetical protein